MKIRLRKHQSGGNPLLREGEILFIEIRLSTRNRPTRKAIILETGEIEYAQWLLFNENRYIHKTSHLTPPELTEIRNLLTTLGDINSQIEYPSDDDCDYSLYECQESVTIQFHYNNERKYAYGFGDNFFSDYQIPTDIRDNYLETFRKITDFVKDKMIFDIP